jgi:hypothetical protein
MPDSGIYALIVNIENTLRMIAPISSKKIHYTLQQFIILKFKA